jgi:hypothetical protein
MHAPGLGALLCCGPYLDQPIMHQLQYRMMMVILTIKARDSWPCSPTTL